ncbi:hypothetical protein J4E86_002687 [Alternaria arbusti]|uniref:uncharacterized protein n=1 Tax=Alternaria arbusti TaxID=232088 RepID=UPI002220D0AE|nr:uncharacterized protein J4E86_002687 [Alternaria arbusti]KAI4958967.1 hypothetical protein J4E86_002687 [Alternaria arbusti]
MLCERSTFFKNQLQESRQDMEGECVICHEDLDPVALDLTYCKTCGNNVHENCIDRRTTIDNTCPTCRAEWVEPPSSQSMDLAQVEVNGFDMYAQWLYGSSLPSYNADEDGGELRCIRLINAHIVGDLLKDSQFVQAVRKEIIKCSLNISDASRYTLLTHVYESTKDRCALRKLFIDLHILRNKHTRAQMREAPKAITHDLIYRLLERSRTLRDEDVWSFMRDEGYIEQDEANIDEVDDTTGNESLDS